MLFSVYINVIMICECKSKPFYLHLIYKHDIPLKLTIAKAIAFGKQRFHGLVESLSIKTLKVRTISVPLMKRLFFIATMVLYSYIVIGLYIYIGIIFFVYCVVCLLLYCMLEAWEYCFLYIYILFLFLTSTSIFL